MPYSYLPLGNADGALLKQLLGVFGDAFDERDTYQANVPGDAYLRSILSNKNFIVIVAQHENKVIGGLAAYVLEKFEQERKEIYIYDLAVLEGHRRHGVATELINTLKKVGKSSGAYIIFVQADKGDAPAIKLYESLGTCEDVFNFDIALD